MNAIEKALWFIESHFASEITLEDLAKAGGASRFYITRAFADTSGVRTFWSFNVKTVPQDRSELRPRF
jgi:AraC-like DNA-binding protein